MEPTNARNYPFPGLDHVDPDQAAIAAAIASLDATVIPLESKHGVGRLPLIVDPQLAARFARALAKLNRAIDENDADGVVKHAAVVKRGWQAMDAAASLNPAVDPNEGVWGYNHNGVPWTVVLEPSRGHQVAAQGEAGLTVTIAELLTCWCARLDSGSAVRQDSDIPF